MSEHVNKYTEYEARTKAIETLLYERGVITPAAVDRVVSYYENDVGPMGGAKVVARAWTDPNYADWLKKDATAAMADMGYAGEQAHEIEAVFNTGSTHNVVVCTLCSCYPWPVLGLPPAWYKSMEYRSRVVADPRTVLKQDFGLDVQDNVQVRVWDSSSERRYVVVPERPERTEGWSADELTRLVSRDSMIGVARALEPHEVIA